MYSTPLKVAIALVDTMGKAVKTLIASLLARTMVNVWELISAAALILAIQDKLVKNLSVPAPARTEECVLRQIPVTVVELISLVLDVRNLLVSNLLRQHSISQAACGY